MQHHSTYLSNELCLIKDIQLDELVLLEETQSNEAGFLAEIHLNEVDLFEETHSAANRKKTDASEGRGEHRHEEIFGNRSASGDWTYPAPRARTFNPFR